MPTVTVNNLIIHANHGVLEQERNVGNDFRISLSVEVPSASSAMATDALTDTVNYAEIIEIVKESMSRPRKLIEAAAGDIISALRARYDGKIARGSLTIEKLAPPIPAELESVGFTVNWEARASGTSTYREVPPLPLEH